MGMLFVILTTVVLNWDTNFSKSEISYTDCRNLLNKNLLITGNYSFHTELWLELKELYTKLGFHCGCLWEEWTLYTSALFHFEVYDTGGTHVIIRVLPITYYAQAKIMPHLKYVDYFVSVTTR
jgi:hypothetical protein